MKRFYVHDHSDRRATKKLRVVISEDAIRLPKIGAAPWQRRAFIGGSDARVIMGADEAAMLRLWQRGEVEPEDLSGNLTV